MGGSRYDGFPQVFLSGDKTKALEHLGRAKSLLSEVQKVRDVMGVEVFQKSIQLGGVQITVRVYKGIGQIFVHASDSMQGEERAVAYTYPVVLSGYIQARGYIDGQIDEAYLALKREEKEVRVRTEFAAEGLEPTEADLALTEEEEYVYSTPTGTFYWDEKTVRAYGDSEVLEAHTTGGHISTSLIARAWGVNQTLSGLISVGNARDYKSYRWVSGTLYTGALSKCAQLVMGLHRSSVQALAELPTFISEDSKEVEQYLRETTLRPASASYISAVGTNYGFCPQYASRWDASDGLYRGLSGWFLVRITRDRILARRLPLFLGSDKPAFAGHYRGLGLYSVADAIDMFKGLPTGEGFPTGEELDRGLSEGWIFDITPSVMPFVGSTWRGYYAHCGWSFNPDGSEAHNVGLEYVGDSYYSQWVSLHFASTTTAFGERVTARLVRQRRDEIYAPAVTALFIQPIPYKVPFLMDGTVQTVLLPTEDARKPREGRDKKVYDAVVWAGFVGGSLQTVSYYHNPLSATETVVETGQKPEGVSQTSPGSWQWGEERSGTAVPTCMYSSVWDTRPVMRTWTSEIKLLQKKLFEYWYVSTSELGNVLAYDWPVFSPVGYFHQETETKVKSYTESFAAGVVAHQDRSVYSGMTSFVSNRVEEIQHRIVRDSYRGPWRAQAFKCEAWIFFQWRLPCAANPESVKNVFNPERNRQVYLSTCGQVCEWVMGVNAPSDPRIMNICVEDYPFGSPDVTAARFPKCADLTSLDARWDFIGRDTSGSRGKTEKQEPVEDDNRVWYVCPARDGGFEYKGIAMADVELTIKAWSPDKDTGAFHSAYSTRNCFGYTYEAFTKHLVQGPGYGKIGQLHAGDTEVGRFNIVFVGVLDGE